MELTSYAGIVVICLLIGQGVKLIPNIKNDAIPVICGAAGGLLGIAGMYLVPDFPAHDFINAFAVGVISGFGATGAFEAYRRTKGAKKA